MKHNKFKNCQIQLLNVIENEAKHKSAKDITKDFLSILSTNSNVKKCVKCKRHCIPYWSISSPFNYFI